MKKILLALGGLLFLIRCADNPVLKDKEATTETFRSDTLHFSLKHPKNWTMKLESDHTNAATLFEDPEDSADFYQENIQIWVEELPVVMNDSMYYKAAVTQIAITNPKLGIHKLPQEKMGENNMSAFEFDFMTNDSLYYSVKGYCLVKGKRGYNFSCTALRDDMKNHEAVFSKILNSFTAL